MSLRGTNRTGLKKALRELGKAETEVLANRLEDLKIIKKKEGRNTAVERDIQKGRK